ncbi:MAG: hypothetical protein GF400_03660 [Candidatus Eisenbacteria bacterium]|nr:hypothetical protein [Candidatus Eisenbacteria bacterium]
MIPVRNIAIIALGLALIGVGFYYLAQGSITLAPFLLVAGYCLVIPLGIMLGAPRDGRDTGRVGREGE